MMRALLMLSSFGAALAAGTAHLAYPDFYILPPLLGYLAGMLVTLSWPQPGNGER